MGGVEVILKNRLEVIAENHSDISADILFFNDYGGKKLFSDKFEKNVYIIKDPLRIRQFVIEGKYDFVISIDTPEIFEYITDNSVKFILEVHTNYKENRNYLSSIVSGKQKPIAITVPSNYFKDIISQEIGNEIPIYVFPNFINNSFIELYNSIDVINESDKKYIGWIGRLDSLKNWSEFIDIGQKLAKERDDVIFLIVGGMTADESIKNSFFKALNKKSLLPSTKWIPFYSPIQAIYKTIAQSNGCYVSTSRGESFGMTVVESMACRCPVVCSNIDAFKEITDSGKSGLLYDLGDIDSAVSQINLLLDNQRVREDIINNSYQSLFERYDPSKIIFDWISLLHNLLDKCSISSNVQDIQ
ncbi:glycosyltransferase family 4 protein [Methanosarcina sp. 2.H.A.1B.4]|uniref:glycosyltransferase family 4 protein n=1 Tax=Methanosarcina sp. 2.H.A.1B.4 TaxID=1483600 RepID=UPI00138E2BA9|nr:glycosyltransferase family 4 protein [Methanosarcina sp. 2.H.A.1B.4]